MDWKTNDKLEQLELLRSVANANNVPVQTISVDEDGFFHIEYETGYYSNFDAAVAAIKARKK